MQANPTAAPLDDDHERAVLQHVLSWHPTILRREDLIRELARDPREFGDRDDVERAVRDLVKVGLRHHQGDCVLPTPAAVHVQGWEL